MTTEEILSRTKSFAKGGQAWQFVVANSNFNEMCHGPNVSRREARGGSLSHRNSNFNGKMHSSNSFEFGFLADHREKAN